MAHSSSTVSSTALTELPTPDHITLLFKCHKSTTLLSVLPSQPVTEIKALLLAALRSRNLQNLPNSSIPLPTDPEEIEFGVLADRRDHSKGWVLMEDKEREISDSKGIKRKSGGKKSMTADGPVGAGLADGTWIAYRVKSNVQEDDGVDIEADVIEEVDMTEDPGWDVVLPSFDDEEE